MAFPQNEDAQVKAASRAEEFTKNQEAAAPEAEQPGKPDNDLSSILQKFQQAVTGKNDLDAAANAPGNDSQPIIASGDTSPNKSSEKETQQGPSQMPKSLRNGGRDYREMFKDVSPEQAEAFKQIKMSTMAVGEEGGGMRPAPGMFGGPARPMPNATLKERQKLKDLGRVNIQTQESQKLKAQADQKSSSNSKAEPDTKKTESTSADTKPESKDSKEETKSSSSAKDKAVDLREITKENVKKKLTPKQEKLQKIKDRRQERRDKIKRFKSRSNARSRANSRRRKRR